LKRGVFPPESIERLTVGRDPEIHRIKRTLEITSKDSAQYDFIQADYGYGKSHLLRIIESIALKSGFGVTSSIFDGYENAFNHPARYIRGLYKNLKVSSKADVGFSNLIVSLLESSDRNQILDWANEIDYWDVGRQTRGIACDNQLNLTNRKAILDCQHLIYRSGRTDYLLYEKVKTLVSLCKFMNLKGLVILADEVESIATLLPTVRSRFRSYEILQELTSGNSLKNCCIYFAVTPDFGNRIQYDASYGNYYQYEYESGCRFIKRWETDRIQRTILNSISVEDNVELCSILLGLHKSAYSWANENRIEDSFIKRYVEEVYKYTTFQREIVKIFVNILEICQQNPEMNPGLELSLTEKPQDNAVLDDSDAEYFFAIVKWSRDNSFLTPQERRILNKVGNYITHNLPLSTQIKEHAVRLCDYCINRGFSFPKDMKDLNDTKALQTQVDDGYNRLLFKIFGEKIDAE